MKYKLKKGIALSFCIFATTLQAGDASMEGLAKKLANPVAAMISLPFQFNYERGFYGTSGTKSNRLTLNVQPVVPFSFNDDWNLISRTIIPIVRNDENPPASGVQGGIGDIVQSLFVSPKAPTNNGWIWGVGPAMMIPSHSKLSTKKWAAGPTAVALKQQGPWTYGALANHLWSFGGDDMTDVQGNVLNDISQTFMQPFVTYTTPSALSLSLVSETSYNWKGSSGQRWTIPIIGVVSKVGKIGSQTVSYGVGLKYIAESPSNAAKGWGVRFAFTMLFPK